MLPSPSQRPWWQMFSALGGLGEKVHLFQKSSIVQLNQLHWFRCSIYLFQFGLLERWLVNCQRQIPHFFAFLINMYQTWSLFISERAIFYFEEVLCLSCIYSLSKSFCKSLLHTMYCSRCWGYWRGKKYTALRNMYYGERKEGRVMGVLPGRK